MASPLDLRRLATRIEELQRVRTHGWHPADEMRFKSRLPAGRDRLRLPDPVELRARADEIARGDRSRMAEIARSWRAWMQTALDMEGLVHDNDPRNPGRLVRDLQRGKFPRRFARLLVSQALSRTARFVSREFLHWVDRQRFRHPQTGNRVKYKSLPAREQRRIHEQWSRRQSPGAASFPAENVQEPKPGKRREEPWKWGDIDETAHVDRGSITYKQSEVSGRARVEGKSRVRGRVADEAVVRNAVIGDGASVSGSATVEDAVVNGPARVEGRARVGPGGRVQGRATVGGDTEVRRATLRGGKWNGQKLTKAGEWHDSYDQETIDALEREFEEPGSQGAAAAGDLPIRLMSHYLVSGGSTKGLLGGDASRERMARRLRKHAIRNRGELGSGAARVADRFAEISDEGWDVVMRHARRGAEAKKRRAFMLYQIVKLALEEPEHRPVVMPLVRMARERRVAANVSELRTAVIRAAYDAASAATRAALVRAVKAADHLLASEAADLEGAITLTREERAGLVRIAFTTPDAGRRRQILGILKEARYSKGFLKWVQNKEFKHPETGNMVQFISLPSQAQKEVHKQWKAGKKEWAQQHKPEGLSKKTELTPEKFDALKEGDLLWISWQPFVFHKVTGKSKTSTGKATVRLSRVDKEDPSKVVEDEDFWLHRSSAGSKTHDIHVVPPDLAKPKAEEPKEEAEEPKAPPAGPEIPTPETEAPEEPQKPEPQAEKPEPEEPKEPDIDSPSSIKPGMFLQNAWGTVGKVTSMLPDGGFRFRTWDSKAGKYSGTKKITQQAAQEWFDKGNKFTSVEDPAPAKPKKKKKKKKEEEKPAFKPTGKHKDREELRGKAQKESTPETKIEAPKWLHDQIIAVGAPPTMAPEMKKETVEKFENITVGAGHKMLGNIEQALASPGGEYLEALETLGYSPAGLKTLQRKLRKALRPYAGRRYNQAVLGVANEWDLEGEDADELYDFKADKPAWGKKLTDAQLMQKFLSKASPETRERMQGMSVADFMIMYKSIMAEDEEEEEAT